MIYTAIICFVCLIILNIIIAKRLRDVFNPFTVMSALFFLPMIISTLKLSNFQTDWTEDAILMMVGSFIVWGIYPFVFLSLIKVEEKKIFTPNIDLTAIGRSMAAVFLITFLLENYLLFGHLIPLLGDLGRLLEFHASSISGLGIITKSSPLFCIFLIRNYLVKKNNLDLTLFFICLLMPITRGSRIDIMLSIICSISIFSCYKLPKISKKSLIYGSLGLGVFFIVFIIIGNYRTTIGGEYEIMLSDVFKYNSYAGPGEIFAWFYGYFCLPFEDFNRVTANYSHISYDGLLSISPITNGLFSGHTLFGIPNSDAIYDYTYYYTNSFAVPTALAYFYLDLGVYGGLISMFIYMSLLLFFYRMSRKSDKYLIAYCLFMGMFGLSAFQALILGGQTFRILILSQLPFFIRKKKRSKLDRVIN